MKYNDYVIKDALSSDTRKMQIKTLNFFIIPVRMAIIRKRSNAKYC